MHADVASKSRPLPLGQVIARNAQFVIYETGPEDTLRSLAHSFLGDDAQDWIIAEFNGVASLKPGDTIVIPLEPINPLGIRPDGYQTVPILVYHRFGTKVDKTVVSPSAFAAQLDYLAQHDYHVVRLADFKEFLAGKRPLPKRAVIITMDDGYASDYQYAYPLLKKHGFPATIFLYTDFVGAPDALTWNQMKEMIASGLIDIQAHSKTHANLNERLPGEGDDSYRDRIDREVLMPRELLSRKLSEQSIGYAYPYGEANGVVVERIEKAGYAMGMTVNPGGNPFFTYPFTLHRTMIFGDQDLDAFKARLHVYEKIDLR